MDEATTPVLVGAGQFVQKDVGATVALSPIEMMAECARRAAEDAGIGAAGLRRLDTVAVVNVFCWSYAGAPRLLAREIGARPKTTVYTTVGGNSPQALINEMAQRIASGRVGVALLAGAEAVHTVRRAQRAGVSLAWPGGECGEAETFGDGRMGTNDTENAYGLQLPAQVYPLFENALRARRGEALDAHRRRLGELCARFSAVAAENPYAWFRQARSAEEIATVTARNRYIAFPYPKYMNAIMDVNQGASVLMTSVACARELGIPESRWVYLRGCADVHDHWWVSERVDYYSSPAIRLAGQRALAMAGVGIEELDAFDLYSCFPCAVQIAREMLGIHEDDPRPLTVTGGLPYHGGPGNNYSMHAVATMMEHLRRRPGSSGLVTALGWYITKHAVGVYSTAPPAAPWRRSDPAADQAAVDEMGHPQVVTEAAGPATVETYTVLYDREGAPMRGIVVGRLQDSRRFVAGLPDDRDVLETFTREEGVGRPGYVTADGETNRFDPN